VAPEIPFLRHLFRSASHTAVHSKNRSATVPSDFSGILGHFLYFFFFERTLTVARILARYSEVRIFGGVDTNFVVSPVNWFVVESLTLQKLESARAQRRSRRFSHGTKASTSN
jgi:hypothetical protein